jgi:hypothetical protein
MTMRPVTTDRSRQAELADLAGVIERLSAALSLGEEPSNFAAALEDGAQETGTQETGAHD